MAAPRFPLTQLPVQAAKHVLKMMSPFQLIGISLLSKKCRNFVRSLEIKAKKFIGRINSSIQLAAVFNGTSPLLFEFNVTEKENGKYVLTNPSKTVFLSFRSDNVGLQRYTLSGNRMKVGEWLEHLQFLFGCSKAIDISFTAESFRFDIDSLRETFQEIRQLEVLHTGCYDFNKLVLRKFLPVKILGLSPSCFLNSRIPGDLLIQNIHFFNISKNDNGRLTHLNLDDLLMMNSRKIEIPHLQKPLKDINKFLKLWRKGSNPHLEYICFRYSNWNAEDANTVMRGIKFQEMPRTLPRPHRSVSRMKHGGKDIYRYDGEKATVFFGRTMEGQGTVSMLVWHDHCIVP